MTNVVGIHGPGGGPPSEPQGSSKDLDLKDELSRRMGQAAGILALLHDAIDAGICGDDDYRGPSFATITATLWAARDLLDQAEAARAALHDSGE